MEFVNPIRSVEDIEAIKAKLHATNLRDYCLFIFGINAGLRVGDLLRLNLSDVYTPTWDFKEYVRVKESKTGKTKEFPLGEKTRMAVAEYMNTRKTASLSEPLFLSREGGSRPISQSQAYRIMSAVAREVGIKERIGTHTLRKTFAYHKYLAGVDITRIQKLLNHSSPATTLAYIGITRQELDDIVLNLEL